MYDDVTNRPRAFLSFSSDDWDTFVDRFGRALRSGGVDAWVSKWEIEDGQNLTKRIYEEGIGKATVVIAVLSEGSRTNNWCQREIATALSLETAGQCRVIGVLLGDEERPTAFADKLCPRLKDVTDDQAFDALLARLLDNLNERGIPTKPPLGPANPVGSAHAATHQPTTPREVRLAQHAEQERIEKAVLEVVLGIGYETQDVEVTRDAVVERAAEWGISMEQADAALDVLHEQGKIRGIRYNGPTWLLLKVTATAVDEYAKRSVEGYQARRQRLIGDLIEQGERLTENGLYRAVDRLAPNELVSVGIMLAALQEQRLINYAHPLGRGLLPILTGVSKMLGRRESTQPATSAVIYVVAQSDQPVHGEYPEARAVRQHVAQTAIPVSEVFVEQRGSRGLAFADRPVFLKALDFAAEHDGLIAITNSIDVAQTREQYLEMMKLSAARNIGVLPVQLDPNFTVLPRRSTN